MGDNNLTGKKMQFGFSHWLLLLLLLLVILFGFFVHFVVTPWRSSA